MRLLAVAAVLALAAAQSYQPIPGTDTLSRGFDMVAAAQNSTTTGKGLLPVWEMTYTKGTTWSYVTDNGTKLEWAVPDQLTPTTVDASYESINDALCQKYTDYISLVKSTFNVQIGVTIGNGTSAATASASFNHESQTYKNFMSNSTVASGFSRHYWALYSLESLPPFLPEMKISSEFLDTINALPASIKTPQDQAMYNDVILYFGTHYSWKADFGGHVHLSTFVSQSLLESHTSSWASNQFALTFHWYLFNLSGGGFHNQSDIHISEAFKEAAHTELSFRGGALGLQTNTTVLEWVQSIPSHPMYLNNTINDLSTIVQTVDNTKAQLLEGVLKSYIKTGKLPATDGSIADYDAFYAQVNKDYDTPLTPAEDKKAYLRRGNAALV